MLNTFRTKIKFWSHIFLWPVIISFIAFYGWSFLDRPQQTQAAAVVGDTDISWQQVVESRRQLNRYYRQIYKENFERMAENLDFNEMAVNQLVNQALMRMAAKDLGVTVSRQEIQENILGVAAFKKDGAFSTSRYQQILARSNMTPAEYEASVESDLRMQKTRSLISSAAPVTEDELKEQFEKQNVKINCDYFVFKMPDFKSKVEETPEAIEAYYNANMEDFRVGDQLKVNYIQFSPATFEKDVEVDSIDIEDYYDQNFEQYEEPEQVKASHILFKVENDAEEAAVEEAKKKAIAAIERLKNGEDFAVLAKELSEGPTGPNGGDLGFFGKGRMDPSFEKAAWDLELNKYTELPVRSRFGWHVVMKTGYQEQSWKSLEDVADQIESKIRKDESKVLAMQAAQGVFDNVEPGITTLSSLVEGTSYTLKESEFFEPKQVPREIGYARNLQDILENLAEGEISIPVETIRGVFVFEKTASKASHIPAFEDVKDDAVSKFKNGTATELAMAEAEKIKAELVSGKTWEDVATEFELKSENTGDFTRGLSIPGVGGDEDTVDELFALTQGDLSKVYNIRSNAAIFKLVSRQDFDQAAFEKDIPRLRNQILTRREASVVDSWLEQMKQELSRQGKFKINRMEQL